MHRRPNLQEAIQVLNSVSTHNEDAQVTLADYNNLLLQGQDFLAARMVVDIVDHYYHIMQNNNESTK